MDTSDVHFHNNLQIIYYLLKQVGILYSCTPYGRFSKILLKSKVSIRSVDIFSYVHEELLKREERSEEVHEAKNI